ncbi:hypothetical protein FQN54_004358 [Arachnomyces sp. PD_36]|nr:hypothetical protein FQN54_004358 [Arachnomyces sp. PD_36]
MAVQTTTLLQDAPWTSPPWKLKSANSDTPSYIHEKLLKQLSPVLYSVCEREWLETLERVYTFGEAVTEQVLSGFLNYAYYGDYTHPVPTPDIPATPSIYSDSLCQVGEKGDLDSSANDADDNHDDEPLPDQARHPFLLHIQLYVFGDTYMIPELQLLARGKICEGLRHFTTQDIKSDNSNREIIFDLLDYAFDNLREEDPLLSFFSLYASNRLDGLRLSPQRLEALMLGTDGKFFRLFLPKVCGSSRDVFSFTDKELATFAFDRDLENGAQGLVSTPPGCLFYVTH